MKVVLDIDQLLANELISVEEYERLKVLATKETGYLAQNIFVGFGVVHTAAGILAYFQTSVAAIGLGVVLAAIGIFIGQKHALKWKLLGSALTLIGSLTAAGGIIAFTEGGVLGFLVVAIVCASSATYTKSALLSIITALALSAAVGAMTAYGHATYLLAIRQPSVTIALFSLLAFSAYMASKKLPSEYERILIAFSRTSLFIVNLGFWVGSLWGDSPFVEKRDWTFRSEALIPDIVFVIAWAIALIATSVWAARAGKLWIVNLLVVFGAIHFYTQYFERLGANPLTMIFAGLIATGIAIATILYNQTTNPILRPVSPSDG